ncbi:hypothetical protein ACFQQB_09620 [Nonomuraea rubra]|uniref:hypothetical protein n=1 Tax=Nonomuraea rubra TaxID=46180 RepID=UPI00360EF8F7
MNRVRRLLPLLGCVLLGCVLLTLYAPGGVLRRNEPPGPLAWSPFDLAGSINDTQNRLRRHPDDAAVWASLGDLYLEQARRTADAAYYAKAQGLSSVPCGCPRATASRTSTP